MLYFANWKIALVLIVCALGLIFSVPNLLPASVIAALPSWVPQRQVNLGLDLRGGSHLLYEVDFAAALKERLNSVADEVRSGLAKARIGYTGGINVEGDHIALQLRDFDQLQKDGRVEDIKKLFHDIDPDIAPAIAADGQVTLTYSPQALAARQKSAVEQSIEIIRRRVDETGTKEPSIQREGANRILVQLPGIDDPQRVKEIIGKTAKMTFQLVDVSASAQDAQRGHIPPGDEILPADADERHPNGPTNWLVQRRVLVSGENLVDAQPTFQNNEAVISFKFDSVGAKRFADATRDNVGKPFAIILDGKVITAPNIREPILGGSGVISGNFTVQSATEMALLLRSGALPAPLTIIEERTVGPDLGADSIKAGTTACIVGVGLVVVFMVLFYGLFGIFADIALFFNLAIMLGSLTLIGATLTLPGIAGIALTMGMAVDANVLIYERIREEMRTGRSMLSSLEAGFKRAFGTILDSHVTTLVAGALLFWLGSGPIKGFAVTLSIGVLTSLFSAILVTRLQIVSWLHRFRPKAIPL